MLVTDRVRALPPVTRDHLLRISALARATTYAIDLDAIGPAEDAGIVTVAPDGVVSFAYPLFGEAVYQDATAARRRAVHAELAEQATDIEGRARHRALATVGSDDAVAELLSDAARAASQRGALDAAAELAELAVRHTDAAAGNAFWLRVVHAARCQLRVGHPVRACELAERVSVTATERSPLRVAARQVIAESMTSTTPIEAIPVFEAALADIVDDPDVAVEIEMHLAMVTCSTMDAASAIGHAVRAVELAESMGKDGVIADALAIRTICTAMFGYGADTADLERALTLEDAGRGGTFLMSASMLVAQVYCWMGRLDTAATVLSALARRTEEQGRDAELAVERRLSRRGGMAGRRRDNSRVSPRRGDRPRGAEWTVGLPQLRGVDAGQHPRRGGGARPGGGRRRRRPRDRRADRLATGADAGGVGAHLRRTCTR